MSIPRIESAPMALLRAALETIRDLQNCVDHDHWPLKKCQRWMAVEEDLERYLEEKES